MHAADLLADAFRKLDGGNMPDISGAEEGVCCITGETGPTLPRKDILGSSFTDLTGMMARESDRIGVNATIALRYTVPVEGKKRPRWPEMMDSYWCDGDHFQILDRPAARKIILEGATSKNPWVAYINLTKKKHGMMRTPVNRGPFGRWAFAETIVDCRDFRLVRSWYERMEQALDDGIGRQSIQAGDMPPGLIKKIGLDVWAPFAEFAREKRNAPLWGLLVWLLPTMAERAAAE